MWRDLDWLPDREKVVLDVSGHDELGAALASVFTSQIAGGKRYDLAINGRRRANATFFESHATDRATALCFGMDLTPLIQDETRDVSEYVGELVGKFKLDVQEKLTRRRGR
jgi:isopropylmalate/homocitrate/citramalate synthase